MEFKNSANEQIVIEVFEDEGLYYSKAEGENAIEWRISEGEKRTAQYNVVFQVPDTARLLDDAEVPADLARTLEAVYTHSPN